MRSEVRTHAGEICGISYGNRYARLCEGAPVELGEVMQLLHEVFDHLGLMDVIDGVGLQGHFERIWSFLWGMFDCFVVVDV